MAKRDLGSSLMFIGLAVYVCWESYTMGLGGAGKPGSGMFSFLSGLGLGVLALIVFCKSLFTRNADPAKSAIPWKPVLTAFGCLLGYVLLIRALGFTITTFLFIGLLLKLVGKRNWVLSLSYGLGVALCAYLLFGVLLQADLPEGPFGIFGF